MTADEFPEWIEQQLVERGWKASDLAREAGIDQGTLSNVLNRARGAGLVFCNGVAVALGLPPETVLRHAGLLPRVSEETELAREMAFLFARLEPDDQRRALALVRALLAEAARTGSDGMEQARGEAASAAGDLRLEPEVSGSLAGRAVPVYGRRRLPIGTIGRRVGLGVIIAGVVLIVVFLAFVEGSWWYPVATDRALDEAARAQVVNVRDRVAMVGSAPQAIVWLDLALSHDTHPSDVRAYLLSARHELAAKDDDRLTASIRELDAVIDRIRPVLIEATTSSPYPVATVRSTSSTGP
jgi:lambda repressor-like predicted transcriptional regulator